MKITAEKYFSLRLTVELRGKETRKQWSRFGCSLQESFFAKPKVHIDLSNDHNGLIYVRFPKKTERETKRRIREVIREYKMKIEFEKEKEKKEEKKRPTAHEVATEHLKKWPAGVLLTLAGMYAVGTKVPKEGVPELINAFNFALKSFEVDTDLRELTEKAIQNLKQQQKEG